MSARERYIKVIESLVNGEEAQASELLHEAFVEKAREIWNDLIEQDEIVEDEVAEDELEEAIGGDKADDFLDDIETNEDEIEAEEMFGEDDEEELDVDDAEMELAGDGEEMDFDMDGELDSHEEEHGDIEDKLTSVEDALADLKAAFAEIVGDEEVEADEEGEEAEEEEMEEELAFEEADAEADADEELEESVDLKSVSVTHTDGSDGKASPVSKGLEDPFSGKGNNTKADPVDFTGNTEKGGKAPAPKDMGVTHPGDGAELKPAPKAKK